MKTTIRRPGKLATAVAVVALGASTVTGTGVASAQTGKEDGGVIDTSSLENLTGSLSGDGEGDGEQGTGSLDNPAVQAGGVLLLGLAVSAALAIGAGIQGGAFDNGIPGLPLP